MEQGTQSKAPINRTAWQWTKSPWKARKERMKKTAEDSHIKKKKLACGPETAGFNPELTKTESENRGISLSILQTCIK